MLPRLPELRLFYNTTIRPELIRLEGLRRRLLWGMGLSVLGVFTLVVLFFVYELDFLVLVLALPMLFYLGVMYWRTRRFRAAFKPAIVRLLLEFLGDQPNYTELSYDPKVAIRRDRFEKSGLFRPTPDLYAAEDYLKGRVGEMAFEMGEAYVQEISPASNRIVLVFSGLFVHARFNEAIEGRIAAWPLRRVGRLKRTIDAYVAGGGRNAGIEVMDTAFRERFAVYAHRGTHVASILTPAMQHALVQLTGYRPDGIYFSVEDRDLFIGLAHADDLLEPNLWGSNVSFALIRQFYADLVQALELISVFDATR